MTCERCGVTLDLTRRVAGGPNGEARYGCPNPACGYIVAGREALRPGEGWGMGAVPSTLSMAAVVMFTGVWRTSNPDRAASWPVPAPMQTPPVRLNVSTRTLTCPQCGAVVERRFCGVCGRDTERVVEKTEPVPVAGLGRKVDN